MAKSPRVCGITPSSKVRSAMQPRFRQLCSICCEQPSHWPGTSAKKPGAGSPTLIIGFRSSNIRQFDSPEAALTVLTKHGLKSAGAAWMIGRSIEGITAKMPDVARPLVQSLVASSRCFADKPVDLGCDAKSNRPVGPSVSSVSRPGGD